MAYVLFFRALAGRTSRPEVVDGVLAQAGLAPADRAVVAGELKVLGSAMVAQAQAVADPEARARAREMAEATRVRVQAALSPTGRMQLDAYVRTRVKSRIVQYRGPMPAVPR